MGTTPFLESIYSYFETTWIHDIVLGYAWSWPTLETLHFMGLCFLIGALLVMDLRLIGFQNTIPLRAVHALMPVAIIGFVVNLLTGCAFFIADPRTYAYNPAFLIKMSLVVLAGLNFIVYFLKVEPVILKNGPTMPTPPLAKAVGCASLLFWFGVLIFGRLLPYLGSGGG